MTYGRRRGTQLVRKTINGPGYKGVGRVRHAVCGLLARAHARVLGFALGDKAVVKRGHEAHPAAAGW